MAEPFVNLTLSFWSSNTTSQSRTVQDAPNGQPGPSILNKVISGFISDRDSSSKNLVSSMDDVDFFYDNDTDSSNTYYGPLFSQLSIVSSNVLENVTVELSRVLRDNSTNEPAWTQCWPQINGTSLDCLTGINATKGTAILTNGTADEALDRPDKVYWALLLIVLPFLAVFGNSLVILSVYKERSLQSVTNYFIVSLACADLLVASVVMPFAVYFLVNVEWELSDTICDFWIAFDVTLSTASILNLVAISIDRFIAVTKPIQYSKHRHNNKRVALTIGIVWIISLAIGLPIVLGLNNSVDRIPQLCMFYNSDFIIYSSLGSFYIPCVLMVFLYWRIFRAIRDRAKKPIGSVKTPAVAAGADKALVIENKSQTTRLTRDTAGSPDTGSLGGGGSLPRNKRLMDRMKRELPLITETDAVTNTGSYEGDEDMEDNSDEVDRIEGKVIRNEAALEYQMVPIKGSAQSFSAAATPQPPPGDRLTPSALSEKDMTTTTNGTNADSGYLTSTIDDNSTQTYHLRPCPGSPMDEEPTVATGANPAGGSSASSAHCSVTTVTIDCASVVPVNGKKRSRFNLGRKHKSSKKKREKLCNRRERKATKTLAIVLGVFLFCWVPFFTCNIMDAICMKLEKDCRLSPTAFLLTTWLGYLNSIVNPIIYTIFNLQFRDAFKKMLGLR